MNQNQEKELLDILQVIIILWGGTFPPKTWAHNMERLSYWMDSYNRGDSKVT